MALPSAPLILLTNGDGIISPGLRALVEAVADLGEILVVAPRFQQFSTGRALGAHRAIAARGAAC